MVTLLLLLPIGEAFSQESEQTALVSQGFVKAEQYVSFGQSQQTTYAAGLMDGMYLAPAFDAPNNDKYLLAIRNCVKDMSATQVAAIIMKYANEHPEKWHMGTNLVAYQALREVCPVK